MCEPGLHKHKHKQKHKHKLKKMENIPLPYAYAYAYARVYAYVTPVHTCFSYFCYAHVYGCAYAYVKVWTGPKFSFHEKRRSSQVWQWRDFPQPITILCYTQEPVKLLHFV